MRPCFCLWRCSVLQWELTGVGLLQLHAFGWSCRQFSSVWPDSHRRENCHSRSSVTSWSFKLSSQLNSWKNQLSAGSSSTGVGWRSSSDMRRRSTRWTCNTACANSFFCHFFPNPIMSTLRVRISDLFHSFRQKCNKLNFRNVLFNYLNVKLNFYNSCFCTLKKRLDFPKCLHLILK